MYRGIENGKFGQRQAASLEHKSENRNVRRGVIILVAESFPKGKDFVENDFVTQCHVGNLQCLRHGLYHVPMVALELNDFGF